MTSILLLVMLGIVGLVTGAGPDNRGTDFITGYMANYAYSSPVELYITTSKTTDVSVRVTTPRYSNVGLDYSFTITAGSVEKIQINNAIRAARNTELSSKGILVEASDEIVAYGTNNEPYSNDAFLMFPNDVLGAEYLAVSYYPSGYECELMIIGVEDNTEVTIVWGPHSGISIVYSGNTYGAGSTQVITINKLDTYQVQTYGDLTGSYFTGTKNFVLQSGNELTNVNPYSNTGAYDVLVEQMLPLDNWGKEFGLVPTPQRTVGDVTKIMGSEDGTTATLDCSGGFGETFTVNKGTYKQFTTPSDQVCHCTADKPILITMFVISQLSNDEPADPAMVTIPPIEQYAADYTFDTPVYSQGSYINYFMFIVENSEKSGLLLDGAAFPAGTVYTPIPNTGYVGGFLSIVEGTHTVRHSSPISVFGGFMYGGGNWESYSMVAGMRLAPINTVCFVSTQATGDGIDNDCDGLIDEEICTDNTPVDDDGDGSIDEDCSQPLPIHGGWGSWGSYSSACYCSGTYANQQPRYRSCDNPAPQYDGNQCANSAVQYRSCSTGNTCPVDGGYTSWTQWSGCSVTCGGAGAITRERTCTNPTPLHNGADCSLLGADLGSKYCYDGSECPAINECLSNPCQNGASCIDGDLQFTCTCAAGYSGTTCSTNINECSSNPCQNSGSCNDGVNGYTCTCTGGWTGTTCSSDVNECSSNPCQNGASCTNGQNRYTCTCAAGYSGTTCSTNINECSSSPCTNGATCVDRVNGYTCTCAGGWSGTLCQTDINECSSNPCQNGASCTNGQNQYSCTCTGGWTGSTCNTDVNECSSSPCQNGASCNNLQNRYTCTCAGGWQGTTCNTDINECDSSPCQNGASCNNNQNSYSCTCAGGYSGTNCQTDINECSSSPCQNGATCNNLINYYTCTCAGGYTGTNCQTDINECSSSPCVNGATCNDLVNRYTCTCAGGWQGTNCQTDINECSSNPCQNGASCTNGQNQYTCTCTGGWTGTTCNTDVNECSSSPCQNGASCNNLQNRYTCTCAGGWQGTNCQTDINECDSSPCQNGATCNNLQNRYTCTCAGGYTGTNCQTDINECSSAPCQNGATCNDLINRYTCTCAGGYTDYNCQTDINECASSPCVNGATCNDLINRYTCSCAGGWQGTNCETDINECDSNPCQNGATCNNLQNRYTCDCTGGWTGTNCQTDINECSSSPCQNGATCNNNQNHYTCTCAPGWTDYDCQTDIDECASGPCQNGATCTDFVNYYTCTCAGGYTGTHCQIDINECASAPCANNATCNDNINHYTCTCEREYTGYDCDTILIQDGNWGSWGNWSDCTETCDGGRTVRVRLCDDPMPINGLMCAGSGMELTACMEQACPTTGTALNGFSNNYCPTGFFPCKSGSITCIESSFRCDCSNDCDDGSDEEALWALCSDSASCRSDARVISPISAILLAIVGLLALNI